MINLVDEELYHIHVIKDKSNVLNKYSDKWIEGNKLFFGNQNTTGKNLLCDRVLNPFISIDWEINLIKQLTIKRISYEAFEEKKKIQSDFFKKGLMFKYYQLTREIIIEEIRQSKFQDKPSRLNSVWLTDKENLKTWLRLFPQKEFPQKVFLVKFTGKVHKGDGQWITNPTLSFEKIFKNANGYWSGEPKSKKGKSHEEYIGNGVIEIIKEIS